MATSLAKNIIIVLLAIDIIWLIYILLKSHAESLGRAIVAALVLGVIFYYLQATSLQYLSFKAIKNDLFPPEIPNYSFTKTEADTQYSHRTIYTFMIAFSDNSDETAGKVSPPPELKLKMDPNGRTFTLDDPESLNIVLKQLNLPPVDNGAPELSTLTGNANDQGIYRWDDYPQGTLTVERSLYQNKNTLQSYYCLSRIIIDSSKY
ncbi:MAG: hypothetical protein PHU81_02395 [Acidobacteriota bacterium]|nr:hypothetical protein [Acidobacteriota bacterium]